MSTNKDCPHRAQCIIDLLAKRKEEHKTAAWTLLLSDGQDFCNERKVPLARQNFEQALKLSDDLAAVNDKDANRIKATALTCVGAMFLCRKEPDSAMLRFRQSASIFEQDGDKYGQAVALFALAQSLEIRKQWREAFQSYEWSQRVLSLLTSDTTTIYLRQQVAKRHAEAIRVWEKVRKENNSVSQTLGFLPIFDRIPARDPRPLPERVASYIETDRLIIEDKPYYVADGDSRMLRLTFSPFTTYIAFRINGDSMNNAGIDHGDCVILRTNSAPGSEPVPENGDIVAVVLPDAELATLTRFRRTDEQIIFEPDSKNPSYKPYLYDKTTAGFPGKIVGIHIATLKPL